LLLLSFLQSESSSRVVNTLLTELDGLEKRRNVFVIAATNRPDMIDRAMVRPGRLDRLLYVDLPSADERSEILRTLMRNVPIKATDPTEMDITRRKVEELVKLKCDGYSGADLAALVREAGVVALKRALGKLDEIDDPSPIPEVTVTEADYITALEKVGPSVNETQRRKYDALRTKLAIA
jgi:ribosome biogenesis ATPase